MNKEKLIELFKPQVDDQGDIGLLTEAVIQSRAEKYRTVDKFDEVTIAEKVAFMRTKIGKRELYYGLRDHAAKHAEIFKIWEDDVESLLSRGWVVGKQGSNGQIPWFDKK